MVKKLENKICNKHCSNCEYFRLEEKKRKTPFCTFYWKKLSSLTNIIKCDECDDGKIKDKDI
jgi:hypothetical protein